jgi:type I restriction enzyme, S subunit
MSSLVPDGWKIERLGEFCTQNTVRAGDKHYTPMSVSKVLGIVPQSEKFKKRVASANIQNYKVIRLNDFAYDPMLLWDGSINRNNRLLIGVVSPAYVVFSIDPTLASSDFLLHLFKSSLTKNFYISISKGTNTRRQKADFADFKNGEFLIPPLPEQKKIASILTSVDEVIENTQKQIDKLQDLKKATMNELLTKGIGHTEFKNSELGRIPKSWEVVELSSLVGSLSGGVSVNSENRNRVGSELGVLKTSCISNGKFLSNQHKAVLSEDVHRVRTPVEAETILFSRMNTPNLVGESGYVKQSFDNLYLPDRLWALKLRDKSKTSVRWLSWLLVSRSVKSDISNAATGTSGSMKNISKPNLLAIKVRQPPVNEQFQIASVINSLDYKRVSTQTKMNALVSLKKSLMQDLLTGKVRVTVN